MASSFQARLTKIPGVLSALSSDSGVAVMFVNGLSAKVSPSAESTSGRMSFDIQLPPAQPGLDGGVAPNLSQNSVVAMLTHYAANI